MSHLASRPLLSLGLTGVVKHCSLLDYVFITFSLLFPRLHPNYIYHPSYLPTTAGLLPVSPSSLNPTAAALSAAAGQQAYFDYTSAAAAAASYPATYQTAAATGIEPYAAAAAVSAGELQAGRAAAAHQGGAKDTHEHGWGQCIY